MSRVWNEIYFPDILIATYALVIYFVLIFDICGSPALQIMKKGKVIILLLRMNYVL